MTLFSFYGPGKFGLSFELYPPQTDEGMENLFRTVAELVVFKPSYMTCTYRPGGGTRHKTLAIVERVRSEFGLPVASHLTCVGSSASDLVSYLHEADQRGIDFIVALRGDPPQDQTVFEPVPGGLSYANELVALIRTGFNGRFGIAVAGYPETHQEAPSPEADLQNLKRKVDAGADIVITQLFFNNEDFYRFRDRCAAIGITVPIVPGILPITNLAQVKRFTSLCGAKLPDHLLAGLDARANDPESQFDLGVEHATLQVDDLIKNGCPGIHFYVLNKSRAVSQLLDVVSLPPNRPGREQ